MIDFVTRNARRIPDRPALVWQDRAVSWRALDERINRLANGLTRQGIAPGTPVIYALENGLELVEIVQALGRIGAIAVPMLSRSVGREIAHVAADVGAKAIVFGPEAEAAIGEVVGRLGSIETVIGVFTQGLDALEYEKLLRDASAEPNDMTLDPDAPVMIRYTSGTTGEQKGVIRTRRIVDTATLIYLAHAPQFATDRLSISSPLTVGLAGALLQVAFAAGATSYIMHNSTRPSCWN